MIDPVQESRAMIATPTQRLLLLILVTLLAAIGVVLVTSRSSETSAPSTPADSKFDGPSLPANLHAPNFSLLDQNGQRVSLSQYRGRVVVLTFIHSLCHDTCPFMVEQIKGGLNDLPRSGAGVPVIGISVAPGEDTAAHRKAFLMHHELTGRVAFLAGTQAQLKPVWHSYAIQPVTSKIDHSTFVLLIDKRGIERIGFPADELTPEALAHDIGVLQRERS
jgi:protein SCO1